MRLLKACLLGAYLLALTGCGNGEPKADPKSMPPPPVKPGIKGVPKQNQNQ